MPKNVSSNALTKPEVSARRKGITIISKHDQAKVEQLGLLLEFDDWSVRMKYLVRFFALSIILLLFSTASFAAEQALPKDWKYLDTKYLSDNWRRGDASKFTSVRGDFNGDGIADEAKLVVNRSGSMMGIVVFLSHCNSTPKMYLIKNIIEKHQVAAIGIRKVSAGKYKTACGKGYWNCKKNESPEISIHNDAIEYFKYESASAYYIFNCKNNSFNKMYLSD